MARKRRDKKRDPSSGQRLVKMGKAALAVGTGAALLSKTRFNDELLRTVAPALKNSIEGFNKDMLGQKRTAINLYGAFKKNIGFKGQGIQENLVKQRAKKIKIDTVTTNSLVGKMKSINQMRYRGIYNIAKTDFYDETLTKTIENLNEYFDGKYEKKHIRDVVKSTYAKRKEIKDEDDFSLKFIQETLNKYKMSEEDASTIVQTALRDSEILDNRAAIKGRLNSATEFAKQVAELQMENLKRNTRQNSVLNKVGKVFGIDDLEEKLFGSKVATFKEVSEFLEDENGKAFLQSIEDLKSDPIVDMATGESIKANPWKQLKELNKNGELDDVIFDKNIRIRTNRDGTKELFSIAESKEMFSSFMEKFDSSLVGRVLTKGIDFKGVKNAPSVALMRKGTKAFAAAFDENSEDNIIEQAKLFVDGKLYNINRNDNIYSLGEEKATGWINTHAHGTLAGVEERMLGTDRIEPLSSENKWLRKLDINQDGRSNFIKRFIQGVTKWEDPNWERNIITRVQDRISSGRTIEEEVSHIMNSMNMSKVDAMRVIHEDNQLIGKLFSRKAASTVVDNNTLATMINALDNYNFAKQSQSVANSVEHTKKLIQYLIDKDTEGAFNYLKTNNIPIESAGLKNLVNSYINDSNATMKMVRIEANSAKKIPIMDIELSETNVTNIHGILRTEVLKEITGDAYLWDALQTASDNGIINIDAHQTRALWLNYHWQKFENASDLKKDFTKSLSDSFKNGSALDRYQSDMRGSENSRKIMSDILEDFKKDFGIMHKGNFNNANEQYYSEYNAYEFIQKSNFGMDLIKNINDAEKWKAALRELNGGRKRPGDVSIITLGMQYMANRLSYGVEEIGLGLSSQSLSSPMASIWNIMTKRVLPAMAIYTAFDYLNDTSQDFFGVGITGAGANTARNLDIMGRKIAFGTGIGQGLDWLKETSVIGEYWTGSNDFQTAEERKDWYDNGYSPMRKSRFWSFGSASEYRGGDITFFQPNYWRRIQSDYHDKWLYGGNWEKWKHSIVPTPTHPFSTLRYLANPYWLEEKHIDDAPTPLTGKMFSEGSFWGAILNPTVGEAIKPQGMLPEVRRRLTGKGGDSRAIVERINERIKNRKQTTRDDLLVVNGTDIRNATYVPYGHPTDSELIITNGYAKGINYMESLSDIREYDAPIYDPDLQEFEGDGPGEYGAYTTSSRFSNKVANAIEGVAQEFYKENEGAGQTLIAAINRAIKGDKNNSGGDYVFSGSPDGDTEGTYYYNNMVNEYNTYINEHYEEKYTAPLINKSINQDHLADIKHSAKNLSGIYGFLGEKVFGENSYTIRYENAGSYQSFSAEFWDANIGGFGGNFMEIARRFFPSQDRSRVDYNPLKNNLPEWLPDYLTVGNPASKLTKHDMRLPGVGYESLNELHPDEFATDGYGAFDRFKILADVAPNSNEYKLWRNIVKHQNLSPELQEEVKEIESRTKRMRGSHEFYEYQYLHTNTKYQTEEVKSVLDDGRILLANNQIISLAGITFNDNYNGELNNFITPGKKITYRTTDNPSFDEKNNVVRKAAVYVGTDNLNKQLMDMGVADRDHMDTSSIGKLATVSTTQEALGAIQELIAHARIPIIHNKFLHIETAREAFESEQINGANFQTWDHPIESFMKPMLNETMRQSMLLRTAAVAYKNFHFDKVLTGNSNKITKFASGALLATLDPSAMMFGTLNWMRSMNNGRVGSGGQKYGAWSRGAKFGSTVGTVAWGLANADNPFKATTSFALAGVDLYNKLELGDFIYKKWGKNISWKGAAAISAGVGLAVSALKNPRFDKDKMFGKWQPKKYKKINEMNEYFDRLEYIKYKGLYEDAARKAALFEKSNIKETFKQIDKNKKRIHKLQQESQKLLKKYNENDPRYTSKVAKINEEINALREQGNNMFTGGKYTKSAVAYKKAMESTIYGLGPGATKDEILAAVPDQYKDYFQAFMDETDEGERKKILKMLPDYMKRPLQLAWGQELEDVESNHKYFKSHKLPHVGWRGWKPNINLKYVKMKTIENEGMILSDFGLYDSEKAKASYEMAPDIDNWDQRSMSLNLSVRLGAELKGLGIMTSNVSLEKTSTPGFFMTADIKQSIEDRYDVTSNSFGNAIQTLTSNFL